MTNKQFDKIVHQLAQDEAFVANERIIAVLERSIHAELRSSQGTMKEEPIMRRKLSFVLVCILTLILLAGVALAIVSFRDTARQIVETEQQNGYYEAWPADKKIALVKAIIDQGYVEKTQATDRLLAGSLSAVEAGRIADQVLVTFTGRDVAEISFMEIMIAAWGPLSQWTVDEQAWYSQLMVEMGQQGEDHTLYIQPEGSVDEKEAVAIARREIAKAYSVVESALDVYALSTSFQVPEFASEGDNQAYWMVEYTVPKDMPEASRLFPESFWVFIHPDTGALLEPVDSLRDALQEQMDSAFEIDLTMQVADSFKASCASLEGMAAFRQKWEPKLAVLVKAGQVPGSKAYDPGLGQNIARLIPRIGMPEAGDIEKNAALENARQCIAALPGFPETQRDYLVLAVEAYIRPDNGDVPLYHFIFSLPRITQSLTNAQENEFFNRRDAYDTAFGGKTLSPDHISIRIDARTGAQVGDPLVLYTWPIHYEELLLK